MTGSTPTSRQRTAIAIRHVSFEDLGTFHEVLVARGFDVRVLDAGIDDIDDAIQNADLAIILGGPVGVSDGVSYPVLDQEIAALQTRLKADLPTLGICLGAQLLARALGARVYRGKVKEIGWSTLRLTPEGLQSPLRELDAVPTLHWHGDTFDLPHGATHLAETEQYTNQAFSWGSHTLALQFHAEVFPHRIEQWLLGHAVELAAAGVKPTQLRETARLLPTNTAKAGARMINSWLDSIVW